MINANELRRGNYVYSTTHKVFTKVIRIDIDSEFQNIEPIPLTEEILLKCGFEKINVFDCRVFDWVKDKIILTGLDEYEYQTLNEPYSLAFNFGDISKKEEHGQIEIKYLHELQNLYFDLTKTELEINL
jgi:hypothetical protein